VLTPDTKVKIRHHLGYLQVIQAQSYALGFPASLPTQFAMEGAMDKVDPQAEPQLLRLVKILDALEEQMVCDAELLATSQVDEIKIRPDEFDQLVRQYRHWQGALANLLSVIPNPTDQRFTSLSGMTRGLNCPVL
jgi:hypothetical protein